MWITEAVFVEVTSALAAINRIGAAQFVRQCYSTSNITVVPISHDLFNRGLSMYEIGPTNHGVLSIASRSLRWKNPACDWP